ncbi:E3 ubiquitin-protein ligase TRIM35-like [Festucalex cinctus]
MARRVEENLQCPACLDIFKDPVILPCCHSLCRTCVQQWLEQKGERFCPVCRTQYGSMDVLINLALRDVCEAFTQTSAASEDICVLHKENLKLFCLDHQELACLICKDAEIHAGHKFCPIDEAVKAHKEKVEEGLRDAKQRLKDYDETRESCNEQATHIKVQMEQVESKIKKVFEELRHFLRVEEEARLSAVREEEQNKTRMMKEQIEALSRDMAALSDEIRSAEEQLTSEPFSFMKNFKAAMVRIQTIPDKPELLPAALLDEVKHVGNLKFSVWERMKETVSYSPVLLDPNTLAPGLGLSEDLTSVSLEEGQQRPNNPERFQRYTVRGSALVSGVHVWDVEVGDNAAWGLGVALGDPGLPEDMKAWRIAFREGKYKMFAQPFGVWNPPVRLQRVRLHVDFHERLLAFSESLTNTDLCKKYPTDWPNLSDNMKMFPYFWTDDQNPLRIIPLALHVVTQSQR